jgi:hypothetical protein
MPAVRGLHSPLLTRPPAATNRHGSRRSPLQVGVLHMNRAAAGAYC